jgi:hypothetical protein
MKEIPLRNIKGEVVAHARVDDEDYTVISQRPWHRSRYGYAVSTVSRDKKIWMHHIVYQRAYGEITALVDHRDRDRLNNLRGNLRPANNSENALNRGLGTNNTTGYFGIRLDKRTGRYQSFSTHKDRRFSIGYFDTDTDAALAHDLHMLVTYPHEFINLNCPQASSEDKARVTALLANAKKRKGKSRYRGVLLHDYDGRKKCWHARIKHAGKNQGLGYYETEQEAALAYNQRALELLGDKAKLNVIL